MAIGPGWLTIATLLAQIGLKVVDYLTDKWRKAKKMVKREQKAKRDVREIAYGDDAKDLDDYIDGLPR